MSVQGTYQADLFSGPAYDERFDRERLGAQIRRIHEVMVGGAWRTLFEIAALTGDPEGSIGAQLRHLRRPCFGAHAVHKRRRGLETRGLWEYRLDAPGTNKPRAADLTTAKGLECFRDKIDAVRDRLEALRSSVQGADDLRVRRDLTTVEHALWSLSNLTLSRATAAAEAAESSQPNPQQ